MERHKSIHIVARATNLLPCLTPVWVQLYYKNKQQVDFDQGLVDIQCRKDLRKAQMFNGFNHVMFQNT